MNDDDLTRPDLVGEVRFRVPLPIVIPLSALALIAALAIGFAKVLLAVPSEAATVLAMAMAINVLGACAFVALRPKLSRYALVELAIVVLYPVFIGIVIARLDIGVEAPATAAPAAEAPAGEAATDGAFTLTATGTQFDTDEITLKGDEDIAVTLDNQSTVPHNFSVYAKVLSGTDQASKNDILFQGDIADPGSSQDYSFPAPDPGKYFFRCDLHPDAMTGTLVVE